MLETNDLLLTKARFEDWADMYHNVWSWPETARYMLWTVTVSEREAKARMERTIAWQSSHDVWLVREKASGRAIGWAGLKEVSPGLWQETSIALGPDYVGRGYGRQLLELLMDIARERGGMEFRCTARSENTASQALVLSCGFILRGKEHKTDPRDGRIYELSVYSRKLDRNEGS